MPAAASGGAAQRARGFLSLICAGDIIAAADLAMRIALYEPDIPQNTGTILRLAACLGIAAHIIEPAGFPGLRPAFRRAGMDYLDQVTITRHDPGQRSNNGVTAGLIG